LPNYDAETSRINWWLDRFLILTGCSCLLIPIATALRCLFKPYASMNVASLIAVELRHPGIAIMQSICLLYLLLVVCSCLIIHLQIVIMFLILILPILEKDFRPTNPSFRTVDLLRSPEYFLKAYRSIQLLHKLGAETYGQIIPLMQTMESQLIILGLFTLIRNFSQLDETVVSLLVVFVILSFCFWTGILWAAGKFGSISCATIQSWELFPWNSRADRKYIIKFKRSCPPLLIGVQGVFNITKVSVLRFLQGLIRGTFRALLTLK